MVNDTHTRRRSLIFYVLDPHSYTTIAFNSLKSWYLMKKCTFVVMFSQVESSPVGPESSVIASIGSASSVSLSVASPSSVACSTTESASSLQSSAAVDNECTTGLPEISLPNFSLRVADILAKGNVLLDFDQFIEETAFHVLAKGDLTTKTCYESFGRRLVEKYPCLCFPGHKQEWVCSHLSFLLNSSTVAML